VGYEWKGKTKGRNGKLSAVGDGQARLSRPGGAALNDSRVEKFQALVRPFLREGDWESGLSKFGGNVRWAKSTITDRSGGANKTQKTRLWNKSDDCFPCGATGKAVGTE